MNTEREVEVHTAVQEFSEVFPHLITATDVPRLTKISDVDWDKIDAAFCCLPHATTQACRCLMLAS